MLDYSTSKESGDATFVTAALRRGMCRCMDSWDDNSNGKIIQQEITRQKRGLSNVPLKKGSKASVVLIKDASQRNTAYLCRTSRGYSYLKPGSVVCYEKSVLVHFVDDKLPIGLMPIATAHSLEDTGQTPNEYNDPHHHFTVERQLRKEDLRCSTGEKFVVELNAQPAPLISLTLRIESPQPPSTLQQASWKRQMVGWILLFGQKTHTTSILVKSQEEENFRLHVEAVATRSRVDQLIYAVLPSTRITIQHSTSTDHVESDHSIPPLPPGLPEVTQRLIQTVYCIEKGKPVSRTFLLSGPPGVGKTYAVKKTLEVCPAHTRLVSLRGSEILQSHSNASGALEREFRKSALEAKGACIVFLDEFDALVSVESMAATLASLLDKVATEWTRLLVVGATNRIDSIPGYLRRAGRFDKEVPLAPPDVHARARILASLIDSSHLGGVEGDKAISIEQKSEIRRIAELCVGYVPADLNALVRHAILLAAKTGTGGGSFLDCFEAAMGDVGPSALRDAALSAPPKITWDDIAGDPGGAKSALRQAIEWPRLKASSFARLGLLPPRGILLHGPPGCAKTTLARAAAGASAVAFLSLSPAEVYSSSYVGEAEAVVRRAFALARSAAPCVLFFDEMDSIFGGAEDGGGRGNSAEARVLSTFLNEMDGVDNNRGADGVLVLGATNRPWTLDSALIRPGRFDKIIYIPPPDAAARRAIFEMQFKGQSDILDLDWLASDAVTGLMTGAELVGCCQEAKFEVLKRWMDVSHGQLSPKSLPPISEIQNHLLEVLKTKKPLLSDPRALEEFRMFEQIAVSG